MGSGDHHDPASPAVPHRRGRSAGPGSFLFLPIQLCALLLLLGLAGCRDRATVPEPEAPTDRDPAELRSEAFPEVGDLVYGRAALESTDPVRFTRLRYREQSRREDVTHDLRIDDSDPVAVRMVRRHQERERGSDGGDSSFQVDKTVIYGLRGLIKFYDRHTRKGAAGVVDDWVNRVTRVYEVEGSLFPMDFAKQLRITFDSETEDLRSGKRIPLTNEYVLTVRDVLEGPEYLERMPFDSLRSLIKERVYVVELQLTFGPEGRDKIDRTLIQFYSEDLGFVVPCCHGDSTRYDGLEVEG